MKAKIYIPYAQGDCVRGFRYGREINAKEYAKMELDEYNTHTIYLSYPVKNGCREMLNIRYNPDKNKHFIVK